MNFWSKVNGDIRPGDTVQKILDRNNGVGPGFEVLRVVLSFAVLVAHMIWLTKIQYLKGGSVLENVNTPGTKLIASQFFYPMMYDSTPLSHAIRICIVPLFFALSGFLVTGSALRLRNIPTFLAFRILRIIPALGVEITLSALVLGPILTTFTLKQYFSDHLLYAYFFNVIGEVQFVLPGLFINNPFRTVNANLWTIPAELRCYIAMAVVMGIGILYKRLALAIAFLVLTLALTIATSFFAYGSGNKIWPENSLPMFFLAGVVLYQWRDRCKVRIGFFVIAALSSLILISSPVIVYLAPFPIAYCAVFLGMYRFSPPRIIVSGDYSYGIYLYGAPLTQALISIFPSFQGYPGLILIPASGITFAFAAASWHFVEKPALKLKTHLPERWFPRGKKIIPPSIGIVDANDSPTV